MAGINYWFPKAFGFKLDERYGKLSFWCWLLGFFFAFIPLYILGFMGMTRRLNNTISPEFAPMLYVAVFGAALIGLGILFTLIQVAVSIKNRNQNRDLTGDPWGGRTLEWATSSPPAFYNFAIEPHIHGLDSFWDEKQDGTAYKKPAKYEPIHMPKNTGAGVIISAFSVVFGFAMIWHIWWMAIVGFTGMIATWIIHSFNDDTDYYVPVEEIERIEKAHFDNLQKAGVVNVN
jgi:cytochrome o ubiquinol oxidase subunit 1